MKSKVLNTNTKRNLSTKKDVMSWERFSKLVGLAKEDAAKQWSKGELVKFCKEHLQGYKQSFFDALEHAWHLGCAFALARQEKGKYWRGDSDEPKREWETFCEECGVTERTAHRYQLLVKAYPSKDELLSQNKSLNQAYINAGIIKAKKDAKSHRSGKITIPKFNKLVGNAALIAGQLAAILDEWKEEEAKWIGKGLDKTLDDLSKQAARMAEALRKGEAKAKKTAA